MTVKEKVLELFEQNRGIYLSGEEIAEKLDCTRGAVWKAVKSLQENGYNISAVTNKGYCLDVCTDILSAAGVRKYLVGEAEKLDISVFSCVESTNLILLENANNGASEGKVVIAGSQTKGRGRLGRTFFSPSETGLYMSILLRPNMSADKAVKITTAAAVAVCRAIEKISDLKPEIKWVNDIYLNGKKVCGILTEASFSMENGRLEYAVLGIGVNAYEPKNGFGDEIKDIAGAVFTERQNDLRNRLAGEILVSFMELYKELDKNTFYDDYRSRMMWIGEQINVISWDKKIPAKLVDIDEDCRLKVIYDDGTEGFVSSGEISIRKI